MTSQYHTTGLRLWHAFGCRESSSHPESRKLLLNNANSGQGAPGLSAEQVLRAAILKQQQLSYTQLALLLHDSQCYQPVAKILISPAIVLSAS